jgi:hypothetical protein
MSNSPFLLSDRERVNSPSQADPQRYQFLDIRNAEPNFGVPLSTAKPISATYILTVDLDGTRRLLSTRTIDSAYTFLNTNSAGYLSNYTTVNRNSGSWVSTYSTLLANSGTWLTESSASSLYFKLTGGDITGNLNILGNVLIFGALSALSGLNYITTNATTTSALSVVNIGIGPALYVQQDGAYDIAQFWDKEGGIAMVVGNIAPPGPYAGVVGIKTTSPNETLTVVGTISASKEIYTQTGFYSAGVSIQRLFDDAYLPKLESSYSTVGTNSASWSSVYSSWFNTSARYTTVDYLSTNLVFLSSAIVTSDLVVRGSFFAQGSAYFANTIITTTSALSVINTGPGPALYVYQGAGGGDIASFYDGDGLEVLHVGNALSNPGIPPRGVIGIKTSFPHRELTVVGEVSASSFINNLQIVYDNQTMFLGRSTNNTNAGLQNIFIGEDPGKSNQFGSDNIFIGYRAGYSNVDANSNVFIGTQAGENNITGTQNVFLGYSAGSNSPGTRNILLGCQAGTNVAGIENIIAGFNAGYTANNATGSILIGTNATGNYNRSIALGYNAQTTEDYQFVAGASTSQGGVPFSPNSVYYGYLNITNNLSATTLTTTSLSSMDTSYFLSNVGIGPISGLPAAQLHVSSVTSVVRRGISNDQISNDDSGPLLRHRKSRGTLHNRSAILAGDNISTFSQWGWTGTNWASAASIASFAVENWTANNHGTSVEFSSNRKGSPTPQTGLILSHNGNIEVVNSLSAVSLSASGGTISLFKSGTKVFEADEYYVKIPAGTTAQRPGAPVNGYVRYNTSNNQFEFYTNGNWRNPYVTNDVDVAANTTAGLNTTNWVDTTTGSITVTLPASPLKGTTVRIIDVAGNFAVNNCIIDRNGKLIQGDAADMTVATKNAAFDLIFYDNTRGWRIFSI